MKKNSENFFIEISRFCYNSKSPYSFGSKNLKLNESYKKGQLTVYNWIDELCFYYLQKDKELQNEFKNEIILNFEEIKKMNNSLYKDGLISAFENIKKFIEDK